MAKRKFQGGTALTATGSRRAAKRQSLRNAPTIRSSRMSIRGMQNSSCFLTRSSYLALGINAGTSAYYGFAVNSSAIGYTNSNNSIVSIALAGASDIAATFDAYRILKVQMTVCFNQNFSNTTGTVYNLPFMYVAKDYDDINTTAGTVVEIVQRPDACQVGLGRASGNDYVTTFVPKPAQTVYSSAVASGYMEPKAYQWISTSPGLTGSFTDPWHYGIKVFVDSTDMSGGGGTPLGQLRFYFKVFYECKHPY